MSSPRITTVFALIGALTLIFSPAFAANTVAVIRCPGNGAVPDVEVGGDGVVHAVYVAGSDVFYVRSTDNGATFSKPLRVNTRPGTAAPPLMYRGPDIAVGKDGTVHVIWYTNGYQQKRPKEEWGVYYSRLAPNGSSFDPEQNINHLPSDNYSLAAGAKGDVAVFWMAKGLFVNRSRDGGKSFSNAEKIPGADPCQCCASRAFYGEDETLFCAYRDENGGSLRDMYLLANRPGQSTWTRVKASGTPWQINACPMTGDYLAGAAGGLVMAWETKGVVSFAHFDSQGKMVGKEIIASGEGAKYPVALTAPNAVTCVSWKTGGSLHWHLFDANGNPAGEEASKPSPNTARHAGFITKTGDFVLVD